MENQSNNKPTENIKDHQAILELYKLHVEMADRVSHRRGVANNLFIALHTSIISGSAFAFKYFDELAIFLFIAMILGIALSFIWKNLILSYSQLNSAKFKVINKIEKDYFLIHPFNDEYEHCKNDTREDFSNIEQKMPQTLIALYMMAIVYLFFRADMTKCIISYWT